MMATGSLIRRMTRFLWRVLLTTALMYALTVPTAYVSPYLFESEVVSLIVYIGLSLIGMEVAGAIGIRITNVEWRETIVAALLFVTGWFLLFVFEFTNILFEHLSNLIYAAPGVFLLPLFDPLVRKTGPAPSRGKMVLVALSLTLVIILIDRLFPVQNLFGLLTFWIGTIASIVLTGLGTILTVGNLTSVGAWLGGLGLMLFPSIIIAGRLVGGFFPMISD